MYEPKAHPPIPPERFIKRVLLHAAAAMACLCCPLLSVWRATSTSSTSLGATPLECCNAHGRNGACGSTANRRRQAIRWSICALRRVGLLGGSRPYLHAGRAPTDAQVHGNKTVRQGELTADAPNPSLKRSANGMPPGPRPCCLSSSSRAWRHAVVAA